MKGRKDVVGAAETGSGKTLAFGIPILAGILKDKEFERKKSEQEESDEDQEIGKNGCDSQENQESTTGEMEEDEAVNESGDEEVFLGIGCVRVIDNVDFNFDPIIPIAPKKKKKLRALIVTPTRELAVQIEKHLKAVAKYTDIKIALVIGGMAAPKQERILNTGPDIVIGKYI